MDWSCIRLLTLPWGIATLPPLTPTLPWDLPPMPRKTVRAVLVLCAGLTLFTGCLVPFSDHADDVTASWARGAERAHRRWDRYFNNLDWDDPSIEWQDESYARGPMRTR